MVTFTFQIGKKEPSTSLPALWGTCVVKKFSHLLKVAKTKTKHGCKLIMSTDTAQKSGKN